MLLAKVNLVTRRALLPVVGLVILLADRPSVAQDNKNSVADKPKELAAKKEQEAFVAWGKEVDGLQAGIRLSAVEIYAANRWERTEPVGTLQQGSVLIFDVTIRNVSKQQVGLKYIQPSGWPCSEDEGRLKFSPAYIGGKPIFFEKTIQPGEDWEVTQLKIITRMPAPNESVSGLVLPKPGNYKVSCPNVLMREREGKLATGEVGIEIVAPTDPKPAK